MAIFPPSLGVMQIAPRWISFTFPWEPAPCDPRLPEFVDILWRVRHFAPHTSGKTVDKGYEVGREVCTVIPVRHKDIARIAADHNVLDLWIKGKPI